MGQPRVEVGDVGKIGKTASVAVLRPVFVSGTFATAQRWGVSRSTLDCWIAEDSVGHMRNMLDELPAHRRAYLLWRFTERVPSRSKIWTGSCGIGPGSHA